MSRITQTDAWDHISRLRGFDAGSLRGIARSRWAATAIDLDRLPSEDAEHLRDGLADWAAERTHPNTPAYVVTSDELPIVWLTAHAHLKLPQASLTPFQARHQRQAIQALHHLHRLALRGLADRRDGVDPARHAPLGEDSDKTIGAVRAAGLHEPTLTTWVWPTGDVEQTRRRIRLSLNLPCNHVVVVSARGYGDYGTHAPVLDLDVVCAMNWIADRHRVPLPAVGNWIAAAGDLTAHLDPTVLETAFDDSYDGLYGSRDDYTHARLARQRWLDILTDADIDPSFFHVDAYRTHLFRNEVFDVPTGTTSGTGREVIAVFARDDAPAAPGPRA
jgi:hypothetical protein